MFGKSDLADSLNRDLARARDKRDALASGVATLTAQIAELEARLSAENDRRERERVAKPGNNGWELEVTVSHLLFDPLDLVRGPLALSPIVFGGKAGF